MQDGKRKKRWIFAALFAAEVLLLLFAAGRCLFGERYIWTYQESEGLPLGEAKIPLPRGSYLITVDYMAAEDLAYCQAVAEMSHGRQPGEEVALPPEKNQRTIEFYLNESTDEFSIEPASYLQEVPAVHIFGVTVQKTKRMEARDGFLLFCFFLCLDLVLFVKEKRILERFDDEQRQVSLGLVLIVIFASVPLFTNYLSGQQDLQFHLMRIEGIAEGLAAGQFPVRMQQNWLNGYGYPVSVMYGDLLLYFPAFLKLAGFRLQDAYKIYVFFIQIVTVGTSYYAVSRMTRSRKTGLLGAALYTLSLYRILNVYYRCAVGEYTAMAFLPLIFVGLSFLSDDEAVRRKKAVCCLIVGYTAILQSHCLSFEMAILFSGVYVLLHIRKIWKYLRLLIGTAAVTILLNLSFLLPFMDYMLHQNMLVSDVAYGKIMQEQGLFVAQLFQGFHYGGEYSQALYTGIGGDMTLTMGLPLVLVLFLFLWEALFYRERIKERYGAADWSEQCSFAVIMCLGLLMSCWFFPWETIGKIPVIGSVLTAFQFAWRFLTVATAAGAFVGGYAIRNLGDILSGEWKRIAAVTLGVLILVGSSQMTAKLMAALPAKVMTGTESINTIEAVINGEYLPEAADKGRMTDNQFYPGEGVSLSSVTGNAWHYIIYVENQSGTESQIVVPYLAYKGYVAVDRASGTELMTKEGDWAILAVMLPAGYQGEIELYFKEPFSWRLAEAVSLLTFLVLIGVIVKKRGYKNKL